MKSVVPFIKIIAVAMSLIMIGWSFSANAQAPKHPRVMELEKELSTQGLEVLKGRFPGKPFMLTVSIDPMMRERSSAQTEKLPSYDIVDEEIVDEWDDPAVPNPALMARVRKITLNVSIPSQLTDDEVAEVKTALVSSLNLIEARDSVNMQKRNWAIDDSFSLKQVLSNALLILLGLGLLIGGLYAVAKSSTTRLGQVYKDASASQKSGGFSGPSPAARNAGAEKSSGGPSGGDVRFDDPIRTRESISAAIRLLEEHRSFPALEDMILLDQFAHKDPARLGALVSEFSQPVREKIFALSSTRPWLDAVTKPGEVSLSCIEVLNRCLRVQRNDLEKDWQELLVSVWRLGGPLLKEFLKGISTKEAFTILSHLPKMLALPAAREAYPGSWAPLLDANATFEKLGPEKIESLKKKALDLLGLRTQKSVDKYRREKELVGFLKTADPATEKEIYTTAGEGSFLFEMRPPFYPIFEAESGALDSVVPQVGIEDWALAFFNTSRVERKEIEKRFSDKQRFRYFELLKGFDAEPPDANHIGEAREQVGRVLWFAKQEESTKKPETSMSTEEKAA